MSEMTPNPEREAWHKQIRHVRGMVKLVMAANLPIIRGTL